MKPIVIILLVLIVLGLAGACYVYYGVARGAKFLIIMSNLNQASSDFKKNGAFTNNIPQFCDIYAFKERYSVGATDYQCVLAAKSPLFRDRGFMVITTNDVLLWIDKDRGPIQMSGTAGPPGL